MNDCGSYWFQSLSHCFLTEAQCKNNPSWAAAKICINSLPCQPVRKHEQPCFPAWSIFFCFPSYIEALWRQGLQMTGVGRCLLGWGLKSVVLYHSDLTQKSQCDDWGHRINLGLETVPLFSGGSPCLRSDLHMHNVGDFSSLHRSFL